MNDETKNRVKLEVRPAKCSPKFLHSNSTSHTWVFSAIAELIDNAYDPDVAAGTLTIDSEIVHGQSCLIFTDDGLGLSPANLYNMLSFGYSDKVAVDGHQPIGQYGNGFKSGSMRIGNDAIVFTKREGVMSVGLLSQTFLRRIKSEQILVPVQSFEVTTEELQEPDNIDLESITTYSLFTSKKELVQQFNKIPGTSGTRIVIYSLKKQQGNESEDELDFEEDTYDILNTERSQEQNMTRSMEANIPLYRRSLREYCSVLYLRPKMEIILRGKEVKPKSLAENLGSVDVVRYSPRRGREESKVKMEIKFGFDTNKTNSDYGMIMYHKNRLIKAYEKVGYQKKSDTKGAGVVGLVEVDQDFLKPNHIKQDFAYTPQYFTCMRVFGQKLNSYWDDKGKYSEYNKNREYAEDSDLAELFDMEEDAIYTPKKKNVGTPKRKKSKKRAMSVISSDEDIAVTSASSPRKRKKTTSVDVPPPATDTFNETKNDADKENRTEQTYPSSPVGIRDDIFDDKDTINVPEETPQVIVVEPEDNSVSSTGPMGNISDTILQSDEGSASVRENMQFEQTTSFREVDLLGLNGEKSPEKTKEDTPEASATYFNSFERIKIDMENEAGATFLAQKEPPNIMEEIDTHENIDSEEATVLHGKVQHTMPQEMEDELDEILCQLTNNDVMQRATNRDNEILEQNHQRVFQESFDNQDADSVDLSFAECTNEAEEETLCAKEPDKDTIGTNDPEKDTPCTNEPEEKTLCVNEAEKDTLCVNEAEKETLCVNEAEKETLCVNEAEKDTLCTNEPEKETLCTNEPEKETLCTSEPEKETLCVNDAEKETICANKQDEQTICTNERMEETPLEGRNLPLNNKITDIDCTHSSSPNTEISNLNQVQHSLPNSEISDVDLSDAESTSQDNKGVEEILDSEEHSEAIATLGKRTESKRANVERILNKSNNNLPMIKLGGSDRGNDIHKECNMEITRLKNELEEVKSKAYRLCKCVCPAVEKDSEPSNVSHVIDVVLRMQNLQPKKTE